jgi:hypothetical protein
MKSAPQISYHKINMIPSPDLVMSKQGNLGVGGKRLMGVYRRCAFVVSLVFAAPAALGATTGEAQGTLPLRQMPIAEATRPGYLVAMRPERDIEAILQDAFDEAVRSGSAAALIKFISRNPDHSLADKARQLLEEGSYPPARKTPTDWVDSKIVEFDAARRAGPDALKAFIARHPGHPLAAEARRMLSK